VTKRFSRPTSSTFGVTHSVTRRMELIKEFQTGKNSRNMSLSGDFNLDVLC